MTKVMAVRENQQDEEAWLSSLALVFKEIAGEDNLINFDEFKKAINVKESYFARRYFDFFDQDGSGDLQISEFFSSVRKLLNQTELEKLNFLFNIFDENGDGIVSRGDLEIVLNLCVSESCMSVTSEQLGLLVDALMKAADKDGDGYLTFDELSKQFSKYPSLVSSLSISPMNWIKPQSSLQKKLESKLSAWIKSHMNIKYIRNNISKLILMLGLFFVVIGLFIMGSVIHYRQRANGYVIIARGCGATLNFTCAVIVLFMLRRTMTWLRNTSLGYYLPIDSSIFFHKALGYCISFFSIVHTVMHLINIVETSGVDPSDIISNTTSFGFWETLLTAKGKLGGHFNLAPATGISLCAVLLVMVLCSLPIMRAKGKFQIFYWSHFLYIAFWVLCLLHSRVFWYYFLIPGTTFVLEKTVAIYFWMKQHRKSQFVIEEVHILPSKVTHLVISKPKGFTYTPGDYVFLQIPDIAFAEWHPFTISSAPENTNCIWLHIRSLGNWTNKLYEFYATDLHKNSCHKGKEEDNMASAVSVENIPKPNQHVQNSLKTLHDHRRVLIDGPYGTPAHSLTRTEHAILVAGGIGVTPFASILQSLLTRHQTSKLTGKNKGKDFELKQVDFIWVNRDIADFAWFFTLLTQLEMAEARENAFDRFLNIHLYLTSAKNKMDLKGVGLQMALELLYQEDKQDLLTGLKTRMQPGRPNWEKLFQTMKEAHHSKVHVYFCGSPSLATVVKKHSQKMGFMFSYSL